jgi:transcriptional regulator with XRE-family HTH domain
MPEPVLAKRLRELREKAGWTQQQLAMAAGLSLSLVTRIEQGAREDPRLSTLRALADALGIGVGELVDTLEGRPRSAKSAAPPATQAAEQLQAEAKEAGRKRKGK